MNLGRLERGAAVYFMTKWPVAQRGSSQIRQMKKACRPPLRKRQTPQHYSTVLVAITSTPLPQTLLTIT